MFRELAIKLCFSALGNGIRFPYSRNLKDLQKWSSLIELVHRLRINVFLDVGANNGRYAKQLRTAGYHGRLISFEPIPQEQERIRNMSRNDSEWIVCGYALGDVTEQREFNVNFTQGTRFSSFLSGNGNFDTQTITVLVNRLDQVIGKLIQDVDSPRIFLKMDTQGFDKRVFDGASGCLDHIMGLQSELSVIDLYENSPHFTELLNLYESRGFELKDLFPVSRTDDGRIIEYDCLMVRHRELQGNIPR